MKPKKIGREYKKHKKQALMTIESDHELFLQAFEKPTQIYRYLRTRNIVSPIFLHRSLWYMKQRRSVNNSKRKDFKLNTILQKVEDKHKKQCSSSSYKPEYMNVRLKGFFNKDVLNLTVDDVEVELILVKTCHKKRKDVSSPVQKTLLCKVSVPVNPNKDSNLLPEPVSIGQEHFVHTNGHSVKSYTLIVQVKCPISMPIVNGVCSNGDVSDTVENEPPSKRLRRDHSEPHSSPSPRHDLLTFGTELTVYDKAQRCLLMDGEYEILLHDLGEKDGRNSQALWETVMDGKTVAPFEVFNRCPTLSFSLDWSRERGESVSPPPLTPMKMSPRSSPRTSPNTRSSSQTVNTTQNNNNNNNNNENNNCSLVTIKEEPSLDTRLRPDAIACRLRNSGSHPPMTLSPEGLHPPLSLSRKRTHIFYQFMYNNNTLQQTEARDDLRCPWCSLNCHQLFSLLKHLRLCHARFTFIYNPHPKGARIDVSINDRYDGSYVGSPHDLHAHVGYAFCRSQPVRRMPVTHVLVYRPQRPLPSLTEFQEPETEFNQVTRQFIQGHNRLYYHLITREPVEPHEIDLAIGDEADPEWLKEKTCMMINEFTDVNEGEKELMKLWNLHIMKYNYIGDCQLVAACTTFLQEHGDVLIKRKLTGNFLLHLVNLYDFGLLRPDQIQTIMEVLDDIANIC